MKRIDTDIPIPAFPQSFAADNDGNFYTASDKYDGVAGMSLRDWFAGQAPEPSLDYIAMQKAHDKNLNPYNDSHKPPLRTEFEIKAAYRYEYADAMLAERSKQ